MGCRLGRRGGWGGGGGGGLYVKVREVIGLLGSYCIKKGGEGETGEPKEEKRWLILK